VGPGSAGKRIRRSQESNVEEINSEKRGTRNPNITTKPSKVADA
jgi:hypothetical protein